MSLFSVFEFLSSFDELLILSSYADFIVSKDAELVILIYTFGSSSGELDLFNSMFLAEIMSSK